MGNSHEIRVVVNGAQIDGWTGYHVESSMITMADAFEMRRPFSAQAWNLLRRDSDVTIEIDKTPILRGFIGRRKKSSKAGTMEISGRCRAGRLVDESAPRINYSGMTIESAVRELIKPWFETLTISDARNRNLRRGKGKRVASGAEPTVTISIRVPRRGLVHPGQSRSQVIHEIAQRANLIAWASADGREFFIGRPNHGQAPQFLLVHAAEGSKTKGTVKDLEIVEDDEDRFSLILCSGVGGQGSTNYGSNVTDNRGKVFDNPFNKFDGTGRDFIHPKRLHLPERDFESYGDAQRVAQTEQFRRDYKRHLISVSAPLHGQFLNSGPATLFAPNTVARVIDEDFAPKLDDNYLIVSCSYTSEREQGEATTIHLVPVGTEIVL